MFRPVAKFSASNSSSSTRTFKSLFEKGDEPNEAKRIDLQRLIRVRNRRERSA